MSTIKVIMSTQLQNTIVKFLICFFISLIISSCNNTKEQPNPVPINLQLSALWRNEVTFTVCGQSIPTLLKFYMYQEESSPLYKGKFELNIADNYFSGSIQGQITANGTVSGTMKFSNNSSLEFDINLQYKKTTDTLTGTITKTSETLCTSSPKSKDTFDVELLPIRNDKFEPNNIPEAAPEIHTNFSETLVFLDHLDSYDEDWFKLVLEKDTILEFDPTQIHDGVGVEYEIFNNNKKSIFFPGIVNFETRKFFAEGQYYLKLTGSSAAEDLSYEFSLRFLDPPDSEYEQNNSKDSSTLLTLPFSDTMFLSDNDIDWLTFDIPDDSLVDIDFDLLNGIEYSLYKGTNIIEEGYLDPSSGLETKIPDIFLSSGKYYLKIKLRDLGSDGETYQLALSSIIVSDAQYEPNDTFQKATPISLSQSLTASIIPNDLDWYKFTLPSTGQIWFDTTLQGSISVYSKSGEYIYDLPLNSSYVVFGPGTHYIRVDGSYVLPALNYNLTLHTNLFAEDIYESNNTNLEAISISSGFTSPTLNIFPKDQDWFKFSLNNTSSVRIHFTELTKPNENNSDLVALSIMGDSPDTYEDEIVEGERILTLGPGNYFLLAQASSEMGGGGEYTLTFEILP